MTQSLQPKPKRPKPSEKLSDKEQSERFKEAAHEFTAHDSEERFHNVIKRIVKCQKA